MAEGLSARDSVASAFAELEKGPETVDTTPTVTETPVETPEAVETAPEALTEAPKTAAERARDESGKFVKTEAKPAGEPEKTEAKPLEQAKPKRIDPPKTWRGDGKTQWHNLPLAVQQEILEDHRLRAEIEGRWNPFEQILAPRRQALTAFYGNEVNAVKQLLALSDFADKQPEDFLQYFARTRGIDLSRLTGQQASQVIEGAQDASTQSDPRLQALMSEVTGLKQAFSSLTQSQQSQAKQEAQQTLDAFLSDPKYPYAQDVRAKMGALLGTGQATSLEDAYEQATWMDKDIREKRWAEKTQADHAQRVEIAQVAKNRAVSISGAPGGAGGTPKPSFGVPPGETARDTIKRLMANGAGA